MAEHDTNPEATRLEPLQARMDAACARMMDAHTVLERGCREFDAVLAAPEADGVSLTRAEYQVRAQALRVMGLTTEFLSSLADFTRARTGQP